MQHRLILIGGLYFHWPKGSKIPLSMGVREHQLPLYRQQHPSAAVDTCSDELQSNQAGPAGRKLSQDELLSCYADILSYERFFRAEGVRLLNEERS